MLWPEFSYEPESHHPFGLKRPVDSVEINQELMQYYQSLINLRKNYNCLRPCRFQAKGEAGTLANNKQV